MITFKAIIIPNNRRKDGTYPVKIRVTFKGVSRRLPTNLVCYQTDLTRGNRIKNADILNRTDELIGRMRNAAKDISPFDLENWDVDKVVEHIKERMMENTFRLDYFQWCEQYMLCKVGSTRNQYIAALNAFGRFLGKRSLDINDITRGMLLDFVHFIDNEPRMYVDKVTKEYRPCAMAKIPKATSSRHLMKLEHMYNAAKDRYNDEDIGRIVIPRSPFAKIRKVFPPSNGQKNLGQPLMQRILDAQTDDQMIRYALDAFVVSFGLMGANFVDMYYATPFRGEWVYNRQKTRTRRADKAEMRVEIPGELRPYIERLQAHRGQWWLPTLHYISQDKAVCSARINRTLRRWCEKNKIPVFTFYAARHTWASLARKAGVEKATIDECLCHKGEFEMADIYAERNWDLVKDANRRVLELLQWPE